MNLNKPLHNNSLLFDVILIAQINIDFLNRFNGL